MSGHEKAALSASAEVRPIASLAHEDEDIDLMDLCQCQGCGAWASTKRLGDPHFCHRNEDGTYEEGGTFQ